MAVKAWKSNKKKRAEKVGGWRYYTQRAGSSPGKSYRVLGATIRGF